MNEYGKPKYAIIAIENIKSTQTLVTMHSHIYRLKEVPNADPLKYGLNREMIHLEEENFLTAFNKIVENEKIKIRSNNNLAIHIVLLAPEELEGQRQEDWLRTNTKWIKERFEGAKILSAVYHKDETSPHIHAIIVPTYEGRLSASHYIPNYRDIHTEYSRAVSIFGYERGRENSPGVKKGQQKFKAEIERISKETLPEPEPGENIYDYCARVQKIHRNARFIHLKEMDDIKTEMLRINLKHEMRMKELSEAKQELLFERETIIEDLLKRGTSLEEINKILGREDADSKESDICIDSYSSNEIQIESRQDNEEYDLEL